MSMREGCQLAAFCGIGMGERGWHSFQMEMSLAALRLTVGLLWSHLFEPPTPWTVRGLNLHQPGT